MREVGACGEAERQAVACAGAVRSGGCGPHERKRRNRKANRDQTARPPQRSHELLTHEPDE